MPNSLLLIGFALVAALGASGCRSLPTIHRTPSHLIEGQFKGCTNWLYVSGETVRGVNCEISFPIAMLAKSPSWPTLEAKDPPLLPGHAIRLARRAFAGEFPDSALWQIDRLSIEAYPGTANSRDTSLSDKRYYVVSFVPPEDEFGRDHFPVWVLMDKTVILPSCSPVIGR